MIPDADTNKLFNYLCKNGHLEDAQRLVHSDDEYKYIYCMASYNSHSEVVQWLQSLKTM
jgi:hypothetical protein